MKKLTISSVAVLSILVLASATRAKTISPRDLSIEELVGQTFMIAIDTDIAAAREADVRAGRLGGALLRWDRFTGDEARAMSETLRAWSASAPHGIPFWLSTDPWSFSLRMTLTTPHPGACILRLTSSPGRSPTRFPRRAMRSVR